MKETEEGTKRRRMNTSEGSNNNGSEAVVVGRGRGRGGGGHVNISDQSFKGVIAESKITACEMRREIIMYL